MPTANNKSLCKLYVVESLGKPLKRRKSILSANPSLLLVAYSDADSTAANNAT